MGKIGPHALDARDQIEAVLVGQHDIGDDEIALARRHPAPQARRGAGRAHVIARAAQRLVQHGADGAVVVGNKDGACRHVSSPPDRCRLAAAGCGRSCGAARSRIR